MKSKVAFTYGWTDKEISLMPHKIFMKYWISITPIEAEQLMGALNTSAYPNMKRPDAKKFYSQVQRQMTQLIDKTGGKVKSYKDVVDNLTRKIRSHGGK